LTKRPTFLSN